MLDHLSIQCDDVGRERPFLRRGARDARRQVASWSSARSSATARHEPTFWIAPAHRRDPEPAVAHRVPGRDRAEVRAFVAAAVANGAEVLHEPRVWPEYHPDYYGGFVRDPDGNNVEAVCHAAGVVRVHQSWST